jgi:hypothetical protein
MTYVRWMLDEMQRWMTMAVMAMDSAIAAHFSSFLSLDYSLFQ